MASLMKPSSRASQSTWADAEKKLFDKDTQGFLTALAFQEADYAPVDATLRKLVQLVDERLNPATNYVNLANVTQQSPALSPGKAIIQARGSCSTRTALRGHVDLDLGLCFPENFKILLEKADGSRVQRSIGQVLGALSLEECLDNPNVSGRGPSGNQIITKDGLHVVLLYVWGKLVSNDHADFALKEEYSPANITAETTMDVEVTTPLKMEIHNKTLSALTRSISAKITDGPFPNLELDIFIDLITTRFAGQEVLVGVDKDGPLGVREYRVETSIPSGKEWFVPNSLGAVDRTALLALKWWRNNIKDDNTILPFQVWDPSSNSVRDGRRQDIKIMSHHFLTALEALHELPATDPLHIATRSSLPFSLVRVIDVMRKVLIFLERAFFPPQRFQIILDEEWSEDLSPKKNESEEVTNLNNKIVYPFPVESLGVCEILFRQVSANVTQYEAIINSKVIPNYIRKLENVLVVLGTSVANNPVYTPSTYTPEKYTSGVRLERLRNLE